VGILDPKWKYTHSSATDIRKTFAKARRKLALEKTSKDANDHDRKVAKLLPRERRA
jgi:hypothetical protein